LERTPERRERTMQSPANRSVTVGKVTRVEICGCGGSVVLSLGAVSLKLDLETAADVIATLECALSRSDQRAEEDPPSSPRERAEESN
jgi:hypothetical protein